MLCVQWVVLGFLETGLRPFNGLRATNWRRGRVYRSYAVLVAARRRFSLGCWAARGQRQDCGLRNFRPMPMAGVKATLRSIARLVKTTLVFIHNSCSVLNCMTANHCSAHILTSRQRSVQREKHLTNLSVDANSRYVLTSNLNGATVPVRSSKTNLCGRQALHIDPVLTANPQVLFWPGSLRTASRWV